MSKPPVRTITVLVQRSVLQATAVSLVVAFLLSFVYSLVYHYQQQRLHVQQVATMLANNASTPEGAELVATQVDFLLHDDPFIKSILFYSTDQPLSYLDKAVNDQAQGDWYNALFANSVSFNRPVTSGYIASNSQRQANTNQAPSAHLFSPSINEVNDNSASASVDKTLVGYINITLDMQRMRLAWLRQSLPLWLFTIFMGWVSVWAILRKLYWPIKDITELTNASRTIIDNQEVAQLPAIQQQFGFEELLAIRQAFVILFERLRAAQQDCQALITLEQQLHNKDLSLDIQRHNFQNMITYELKTSLNTVLGGLQLLDSQYLNEEQKDTLAVIRKGCHHLEMTLEQIVELSRIEKGQVALNLSEFNPLRIIADLLEEFEPLAKQKGLELVSRIHHIDYTLEGDVGKIKQVLRILLDNAIKFTSTGEVIIESQLAHFTDSIRWQIKLIDTGVGIDNHYIEDIFTPFFQVDPSKINQYEGMGISLPIAQQMLQLMGGSIEVNSELGVGSQFKIMVPLRIKYKGQQQQFLTDVQVLYYHNDENSFLVEALQRLGATVMCQSYEQAVLDQVANIKVDIVMFAEDILPEKAEQLARQIRRLETTDRVLLIYWYSAHKEEMLDSFEHGLKSAGIDYCHSGTRDFKVLSQTLKKWLT